MMLTMKMCLVHILFLSCTISWTPCLSLTAISPITGVDGFTRVQDAVHFQPPTGSMSMLLVDVENVRGKTNFQQSHEAFVARACAHHHVSTESSKNNKVNADEDQILMVLVMDHGAQTTIQTGGPLSKHVAMVFAGPHQKADQVITHLAQNSLNNKTRVVSSDNQVMRACQSRATIVSPMSFLHNLQQQADETVANLFPTSSGQEDDDILKSPHSHSRSRPQQSLREEIAARQDLQMIDRLINPRGKQKKVSRKQRTKLMTRQRRAKERLTRILETSVAQGSATFHSVIHTSNNTDELEGMVQAVEDRVQSHGEVVETTYERQLLAERLRRRLADAGCLTRVDIETNDNLLPMLLVDAQAVTASTTTHVGQRFRNPDVRYDSTLDGASLGTNVIRVRRNHGQTSEAQKPLRLLVMSDTHGMEEQLFKFLKDTPTRASFMLPAADVLIHCGDFWGSRSRTMQLDSFLAAQTHIPTKIVVRGNHDPRTPGSVLFPKSRAVYVTKTSTIELPGGVVVGMRPHSRNYNDALLPPNCEILISHEPPFGILDYTYHDQRAGSLALRQCVESSVYKPSLWLCGHIHEGRGAIRHLFSTNKRQPRPGQESDTTYVINAATANEGKARVLVNGPVLVDLLDASEEVDSRDWESSSPDTKEPLRLMRPDSLDALMLGEKNDGDLSENSDRRCLLAVDLGLRTGTAVFDENGTVLAANTWRFHDPESLDLGLRDILTTHNITHVVIEGEDRKLFYIWRNAIEKFNGISLARVVADDWRRMLLSNKEMRDARRAKSAAGLIAKQILHRSMHLREGNVTNVGGANVPLPKMSVDAAEALLIGHYAVRVLGWVPNDDPPVKRYTNGDVARL